MCDSHKLRLQDRLATERTVIRTDGYEERDRIKEERAVLPEHMVQGGWGRAALPEYMDMTGSRNDDGVTIADRKTVAEKGTQSYSALFAMVDGKFVDTYAGRLDKFWQHDVPLSAQIVHTAPMQARHGRTLGSSEVLVAEMWQTATRASERWAPAIAWAMHKRLQNSSARQQARSWVEGKCEARRPRDDSRSRRQCDTRPRRRYHDDRHMAAPTTKGNDDDGDSSTTATSTIAAMTTTTTTTTTSTMTQATDRDGREEAATNCRHESDGTDSSGSNSSCGDE